MEPKKITELPLITNPSLSGLTTVVVSGVTYGTTLESIKTVVVDEQEHTFNGDQVITGNLTVNGQIINIKTIPNITYAELLLLISTSGLTEFSYYVLSDFATTYWMLDGRGNECNGGVPAVGPNEPLVLFATSSFTIDPRVYSVLHHDDIIEYDWDYTKFQDDDAFFNIPNFKGVIEYRKEVIYNNSAGWDIRAVKFRRWESIAPVWDSGTTYNLHDVVKWNNRIYKSMTTNINRDPSLVSSNSDWVMMINQETNVHWNSNASGITFDGVTIYSGPSYFDFDAILLNQPSSYNNEISPSIGTFVLKTSRLLNIILFGVCHDVHIKESCSVLTIGTLSYNLDIRYGCYRMIFGRNNRNILVRSNSNSLIFSEIVYNVDVGNDVNNTLFGYNSNNLILGSNAATITFGVSCRSINIGSYCDSIYIDSNCNKITIGQGCHDIDIESSCSVINMAENCGTIEIGDLSRSLSFDNSCHDIKLPLTSIYNKFQCNTSGDFTGGTLTPHISANYHCDIVKNSAQDVYLTYLDGSNINQFIIVPQL